jgi:predicted nucleic acid-binding protein
METVIDSVVLIGAFYRNDQWHLKSAPIIRSLESGSSHAYITDFILAEVANFLHQKAGHHAAVETLDALESAENISIIRLTDDQFVAGRACFEKYNRLSFVDALTVAYMQEVGLIHIYSFDSDFDGINGIIRLDQPQIE